MWSEGKKALVQKNYIFELRKSYFTKVILNSDNSRLMHSHSSSDLSVLHLLPLWTNVTFPFFMINKFWTLSPTSCQIILYNILQIGKLSKRNVPPTQYFDRRVYFSFRKWKLFGCLYHFELLKCSLSVNELVLSNKLSYIRT